MKKILEQNNLFAQKKRRHRCKLDFAFARGKIGIEKNAEQRIILPSRPVSNAPAAAAFRAVFELTL